MSFDQHDFMDEAPKRRLYVAHPIGKRHEVRAWELDFEKRTGIELANPFYDTDRDDIKRIDRGETDPFDARLDANKVVEGDLKMIDGSDGIVAWADRTQPSIGTFMEVWYTFSKGMPVYIVSPDWGTHPWLIYVTRKSGGFIVKSYEEFEERIVQGCFN